MASLRVPSARVRTLSPVDAAFNVAVYAGFALFALLVFYPFWFVLINSLNGMLDYGVSLYLPRLVVAAAVAGVDDVGAVLPHAAAHSEVGAHRRVGPQLRHPFQHRPAEPDVPPCVEDILAIHEQQLHRCPPSSRDPRAVIVL